MPDSVANTSGVVPEAALDRILEALSRSRKYLDAEKSKKLDELFSVDTFLAFGVLLAIWAGFHLTPVAWIADTILGFWGAYQLGSTLAELVGACREAASAATDAALEMAAQRMAHALTDAAVDVIAVIIGATLFGTLRAALRPLRRRLLPNSSRFVEPGRVVEEPRRSTQQAEPVPKWGPRLTDLAVGAGIGVGMTQASPAAAGLASVRVWPWVLGGLAGVGLVAAGVAAISSRAPRKVIHAW